MQKKISATESLNKRELTPLSGAPTHVAYACARAGVPSATSFRLWVNAAIQGAKAKHIATREVSIRLVDTDEARIFNRDYRHKDYATNVLSFPFEAIDFETTEGKQQSVRDLPLGDLVICAAVVQREAREQNKQARDHFAHMTVHGVLHLLGFDHEIDADATIMEALEVKILSKLGIANPYGESTI